MKGKSVTDLFSLENRVAIITGGGGMLGYQHAAAIAGLGGIPVLLDISRAGLDKNKALLQRDFGIDALVIETDITSLEAIVEAKRLVLDKHNRIDILINNAANNPKVEAGGVNFSRLENFPREQWLQDIDVGLGGAFNCAKVFGAHMAGTGQGGVILNIASDLSVIAPDQRLYQVEGLAPEQQPVKPVTYSVVKHGLVGLTKYLATYWCDQGVRCNALSPGGIYAGQNDVFVSQLVKLIPMGRMANNDEYCGAVAFLCSDASAYMNGVNLVVDGGRSVW